MKKEIAGMDLHSNNVVIGVMDMDGHRLASRKMPCDLKEVVKFLAPFKKRLERVAVESTYNWYWLVDGLRALKYPVVLANPAGMAQYSGIKHADDTNDAFFIAELLRLRILPTGHIYDAELRPVRDLLRRRLMLVHQRTALMLTRAASVRHEVVFETAWLDWNPDQVLRVAAGILRKQASDGMPRNTPGSLSEV